MNSLKTGDIVIIKDLDEKEYSNSPLGFEHSMYECVGKKGIFVGEYCGGRGFWVEILDNDFVFFKKDLVLYNPLKDKFKYILRKIKK